MDKPPTCSHEGCDQPTLVQCPECGYHWKIRFDAYWAARFPDEDLLPFEAGDEDETYPPDTAYAAQMGAGV